MTKEEILRNAEALAETVPDEKVRGLVRQAYIKGAEDNAVGDSETFAEHYGCVPEPENEKGLDAVPVRFEEEDGEKYPVVDYKLMGRKPAEWSRQSIIDALTEWLTEKIAPLHKKSLDGTITEREEMFRAALLEMRSFVNSPDFQIGKERKLLLLRHIETGKVFYAEYSSESAEYYEQGTGIAYSPDEVEFVKD